MQSNQFDPVRPEERARWFAHQDRLAACPYCATDYSLDTHGRLRSKRALTVGLQNHLATCASNPLVAFVRQYAPGVARSTTRLRSAVRRVANEGEPALRALMAETFVAHAFTIQLPPIPPAVMEPTIEANTMLLAALPPGPMHPLLLRETAGPVAAAAMQDAAMRDEERRCRSFGACNTADALSKIDTMSRPGLLSALYRIHGSREGGSAAPPEWRELGHEQLRDVAVSTLLAPVRDESPTQNDSPEMRFAPTPDGFRAILATRTLRTCATRILASLSKMIPDLDQDALLAEVGGVSDPEKVGEKLTAWQQSILTRASRLRRSYAMEPYLTRGDHSQRAGLPLLPPPLHPAERELGAAHELQEARVARAEERLGRVMAELEHEHARRDEAELRLLAERRRGADLATELTIIRAFQETERRLHAVVRDALLTHLSTRIPSADTPE